MIYTIGHTENYRKAIGEHGQIYKSKGGYAFASVAEAEAEIERMGKVGEWSIWCMEGTMEGTTVHESERYFILLDDRFIVREYQREVQS